MTWFKNDDAFWRHRKVRKLGRDKLSAVGLWQLAGTWCCDNVLTNTADGFVPRLLVEELGDARHKYAKRLVEVGLWDETEVDGERGYLFHDWADYNPTKASVEAEREEWRSKKANQRKRRGVSPGDTNGDSRPDTTGESPEDSYETLNGSPQGRPSPPVPVPVPSLGHLGGERPVGRRAGPRPPERCPKHLDDPKPPPCGRCADYRRAAEAWDADQAAAKDALADELAQARADPRLRCEHGTDGGLHRRSDTGESPCALCRAEQATRSPA